MAIAKRNRHYEVWMEGYQATGESATASFLGETEASSFKKACKNVISEYPDLIEYYDNKDNTVWGCRLFDNEGDAREAFG